MGDDMNRKITLIASFTLVIDQIIKYIFSNVINGFVLIPNFISFIYAKNDGVAFSMLSGNRIFIIIATLLLLWLLFYMLNKEDNKYLKNFSLTNFAYGLLLGGILGNLIDRVIRGYVVDYVSLNIIGYHFPIFNFADVSITLGVILLSIHYFRTDNKKTN